MKLIISLPTALLLSFNGLTAAVTAQEKSAEVPVAPSTTVTEERSTTAVLPDPELGKIEGKIQRMETEKNQLMLRTRHGDAPIAYNILQATKIIDLDGKPVDPSLLIPEVPVEVHYVEDANELIASKVVVQRYQAPLPGGGVTLTARETRKAGGKIIGETVKTTIQTRSGTLRAMNDGLLTVLGQDDAHPVQYRYSESTQWVNSKGEPIPVGVIKPGSSVKVSYTKKGEEILADQVVVGLPAVDPVPEPKSRE